jgi:hypothetical protein
MSYGGVGSYYQMPMGSYYTMPMGAYYEMPGMSGFGSTADTFSAGSVWADVQQGGSCYGASGPIEGANVGACNAAGGRATRAIQAALNEMGYGPISVTGRWDGATGGKWRRFLSDHGLQPGPGLGVSEQGLLLMEKLLKEGKTPGPQDPVVYDKQGDQYIPRDSGPGSATAGLGTGGLLLGALVIGGLGYAAYQSGKKKKSRRI